MLGELARLQGLHDDAAVWHATTRKERLFFTQAADDDGHTIVQQPAHPSQVHPIDGLRLVSVVDHGQVGVRNGPGLSCERVPE